MAATLSPGVTDTDIQNNKADLVTIIKNWIKATS